MYMNVYEIGDESLNLWIFEHQRDTFINKHWKNDDGYLFSNCNDGVYVNLQQSNINYTKWIERPEMVLNPSDSCNRQYICQCECNNRNHNYVIPGTFWETMGVG